MELEEIGDVKRQIIYPAKSVPIIGIIQDGLTGSYNMTQQNVTIHWKEAMNMLSYVSDNLSVIKKGQNVSGTELYSFIIPEKINLKKGGAEIVDGILNNEKGVLKKDHLGSKKRNSIIHLVWDEYGPDETMKFLDNVQRLVNAFNLSNGFTVGFGDLMIPKEIQDQVNHIIQNKKLEVEHLITEIENNPDLQDPDIFERVLDSELSTLLGTTQKLVMNNLEHKNNFNLMISSGAKGGGINMIQMVGCLGQQAIEGGRIKKRFNDRSLVYFFENDDRALSRGFVENSFIEGVDPCGFVFHLMGGREGLIDTAIKTADSGYVQRKLIKMLEDVMVKYDNTVRDESNNIIQYIYGDNGIDTIKQTAHKIGLILVGNTELRNKYTFRKNELKGLDFTEKDNEEYYEKLKNYRDVMRDAQIRFSKTYIVLNPLYALPVNMHRIIANNRRLHKNNKEKLEPKYILDQLESILSYKNTQLMCLSKKDSEDPNSLKYKDERQGKFMFEVGLHEFLSPKRCIIEYGLNKKQFDTIVRKIIDGYNDAVAQPGEMVGVLSAQSAGEQVTQFSTPYNADFNILKKTKNKKYEYYKGPIGKYIDDVLKKEKHNVYEFKKDSVVLEPKEDKYYVLTVNRKTEKTQWKKLSEFSRHPSNGNLVKVTTKTGRETTTTLEHSHLARTKLGTIKKVRADKLKIGDRIPVCCKMEHKQTINTIKIGDKEEPLDFDLGWFIGAYLAEGCYYSRKITITNKSSHFEKRCKTISKRINTGFKIVNRKGRIMPHKEKYAKYGEYEGKEYHMSGAKLANFILEHCGKHSLHKKVPAFAYFAPKEFIKGLLRGYFDGDGNVNASKQVLRVHSINKKMLGEIGLLLNIFGIFGTINVDTTKQNHSLYYLLILRKYIELFRDNISSDFPHKKKGLDEIVQHVNSRKNQDNTDQVPFIAEHVSSCAKTLDLPGHSRNYEAWVRREKKGTAIGKKTLSKYYDLFKRVAKEKDLEDDVADELKLIKQAIDADIIWDPIVDIEIIDDPKEMVYDIGVKGNNTFMVDDGIFVHNTLNTFHKAGVASMGTSNLGLGRIKEILHVSKNIKEPKMMIYLKKKYRDDYSVAKKIASGLEISTIGDIRDTIQVIYDPNVNDGIMKKDNVYDIYYTYFPTKMSCQTDIKQLPWVVRIALNREQMLNKEVTLLDIKSKFCSYWEKRSKNMKGAKKPERSILENITKCAILSNDDNDDKPIIHIRFEMNEYSYESITNFVESIVDNFKLKGIDNINKIEAVHETRTLDFDKDGNITDKKHYIIYSDGINLVDLRYINGIDLTKTTCNDVMYMYKTFGIEAARSALIHEFKTVYEGNGNTFNYQHLSILVDLMTRKGLPISIDRHGMAKTDRDPLSMASFEKAVDILQKAAVFGEIDYMTGVSSRIMTGQVIKGGTGMCETLLDIDMIEKSEYLEDLEVPYKTSFNELTTTSIFDDILGNTEQTGFVPM